MEATSEVRDKLVRVTTPQLKTFARLSLVVLSVVLVSGGQVALLKINGDSPNERSMQTIAGCLFVVGALLFGGLAPSAFKLPRLEFPRRRVSQAAFQWRNRWTLAWLSSAFILAVAAVGLFVTGGESPVVVFIWLSSILALLVSQLRNIRIRLPVIAPNDQFHLAILAVLLLIALVTRTYHLTTLPYNVDGDYALSGLQARSLVDGETQHIFAYAINIPYVGFLPAWFTMKIWGTGLAGLYASGVIEGLFLIVGIYLLGRDLFSARVGLFAAALMTISETHLAASRQSSWIDPVVLLVFAVYFLLMGMREGRGWAIVTSGALSALCVEVYYTGRLIIIIIGFILFYLLIFRRSWLWARRWTICLWVVAVLIALGPMLVVFFRGETGFGARFNADFILGPDVRSHQMGVYHVDTIAALLLEQARHSLLMFNYYTDTGGDYAIQRPFLDPVTGVLFILGIGYALFRWRRLPYVLLLVWTLLGVIIAFLTVDPPSWAHLIIVIPPDALLPAVALTQLYGFAERGLARLDRRAVFAAAIPVTLLLATVGVQNWNAYVAVRGTTASGRTRIGRYLADQPLATRAYLVSIYYGFHDPEFRFLAPDRLVANLTPEQAEGTIVPVGTPTLLILTPEQRPLLDDLQEKIPTGQVETHIGNTPSEVAFYVFRLP